ncbi:MAG: methionine--tRNA ligase [bacterium]
MSKKILVAVAWPYVNGDIHLGHLAGYLLPADIFARYQRLCGNDVLMVSGSDCHGTPITVEADKKRLSPAEVVEEYHQKDLELFKAIKLDYNLYTKTTTENHKRVVQEIFLDLLKAGYIVKDTMQQYYSAEDQAFLPDRYVEGTCPHCQAKEQRSDQCESCGRWLKDGELINPYSKLTKNKVALKATEHYFLDLASLVPQLQKFVSESKGRWRDWVYKETDGWLKEGLQKRAITRDMDWAIDLPIDEIMKLEPEKQLKDFQGKKIYVWFEAVVGYLSAPQEWVTLDAAKSGIIWKKNPGQSDKWQNWWLNPESEHYYFMGQDNLVFHTLMWPAQLIGSGRGYILPHNVFVNKFMNYDGKKFSKSRNWTIDSMKMVKKYGVDATRYYIAANLPENKEGNFTWEGFVAAVNNELVANLGNFVNRTLKFFEVNFYGELIAENTARLPEIKIESSKAFTESGELIEKGSFVAALEVIMRYAAFANKYFNDQQIWTVIKKDRKQAEKIMFDLLNIIYDLAIIICPFLPESATRIATMLGICENLEEIDRNHWQSETLQQFKLQQPVEILIQKLDAKVVLQEKED